MPREHPSNKLYRNEIENFRVAVSVFKNALRFEQSSIEGEPSEEDKAWYEKYAGEADKARAIYDKHYKAMIEAASQEMESAGLEGWALALSTGEYQHLAI